MAREACKRLSSIWRSPLSLVRRLRLFRATVELVLLYGCGTWTVNQEMLNILDGCYTRLLRIVHGVDWTTRIRNTYLYGNGLVPPVSTTVATRSLKFAGHPFRAKDLPISNLILWEQNPRSAKLSYVKTLCQYTGTSKDEIKTLNSGRQRPVEVHLGVYDRH